MKLNQITFVFPKPLEGDALAVWQDNLGRIGELANKELEEKKQRAKSNRALALAARVSKSNKIALDAALAHLTMVQGQISRYTRLVQQDEKTWVFIFPDSSSLLDIKIPFFDKRIKSEFLNPNDLVRKLEADIFPATTRTGFKGMGIKPEKISIEAIEDGVGGPA